MRGPKPAVLALSAREQRALEELVRRHSTPQQLAQRGRMILAAAQGKNNGHIARELGVKTDTVRCWRMRWIGWQKLTLDDFEVA
jgi:putative transposase